jgi:hypothetical protein
MQSIIDEDAYINSIEAIECKKVKAGYMQYTLKIMGRTRFMQNKKITKEPIEYNIKIRYSEILEFHKTLATQKDIVLPEFPPKKFINSTSKDFIEKRMNDINDYFKALFASNISHIGAVISFCTPVKSNIILCGCGNSYMGFLFDKLVLTAKALVGTSPHFHSMPSHDSIIISEEASTVKPQLTVNKADKLILSKDDSSINSNQLPIDYLYDNMVFRIDLEQHCLGHVRNRACMNNVISKWVENDLSIIVCVNLHCCNSYEVAKEIVAAIKHTIGKKHRPIFIVVGMFCNGVMRMMQTDEVNSMIVKHSICYPMKYIEVDIDNSSNIADTLHYLLWSKEMRDFE